MTAYLMNQQTGEKYQVGSTNSFGMGYLMDIRRPVGIEPTEDRCSIGSIVCSFSGKIIGDAKDYGDGYGWRCNFY